MKKDIHPKYQQVLFVDPCGFKFVCGSALQPQATEMFEGKKYPVYHLSISSASHPFFTGDKRSVDSEGQVKKFMKRFGSKDTPAPQQQDSVAAESTLEKTTSSTPKKAAPKKAPSGKKKV